MKKFLLFVVITIVAFFLAILLAINLSDAKSGPFVDLPMFEYKQGYIDIDGIRYVPDQLGWHVDERGERIGYLEGDNGILNKRFYQSFYHGLYEIKDTGGVNFYQPHNMFADMEYRLLVSEKINLGYPKVETCGKIETPYGEIITDPELIKEFFQYADNATSSVNALFPAEEVTTFRIFHKQYSSIFIEASIYKSKKDGSYALENFDQSLNGYIQVPKEFAAKLGINTD